MSDEYIPSPQRQEVFRVKEESFLEKWHRISEGLKAPNDSGEYKYAVLQLQRIFGPGSVSTAVCGAVLLMLAVFLTFKAVELPSVLAPEVLDPVIEEPEPLIEDPPEPEVEPEDIVPVETSHMLQDSDVEAIVNQPPSYGDESTEDVVDMVAVDIIQSSLILKDLYGNRHVGGRAAAAARHGDGTGVGLTAVMRALRWLKANQNADGSWSGSNSKIGMTGLALLCYMGHGETTASPEFGETVTKAIHYLMYQQLPDGRWPASECGDHYVYGHSIATYALAESYSMTRIVGLKNPVERAATVIIEGQQPGGSWDYDYNLDDSHRKDLSVTAWQVQALKAAKLALSDSPEGLPGLDAALKRSVDGVKGFGIGGGSLSYDTTPERRSVPLTGAGVLCLQLLGEADDNSARDGIKAIRDAPCTWGARDVSLDNTYAWYYLTQAKFQNNGNQWDRWNDRMLPMLTENQLDDGHWEHGSTWQASPVYDTTLCCLTLEVYYRYLPTYERIAEAQAEPQTQEEEDLRIAIEDAI